jgi:exopolysaccharide biosynthesis polyprenyl glycosylphosphotransferase
MLSLAADVAIIVVACFFAATDGREVHFKAAAVMTVTAAALWACVSRALRHYEVDNGRGVLGDFALTLVLVGAVVLPMALLRLVVSRYATTTGVDRFVAVLVPATLFVRLRTTGLRLWRARPVAQALIVGLGALGRLTQREIRDSGKRQRITGYLRFDEENDRDRLEAPVLGTVHDIEAVLRAHVVDEVYFATSAADRRSDVQRMIEVCEGLGTPFALPACGYRLARAHPACPDAISDGYVHFAIARARPLQTGIKRCFDIVASAAALVALSPLLLAMAVAIAITSRGPILFRQSRVGLHGRTFNMLKFRSMVNNAEALRASLLTSNEQTGPVFKMSGDPRVTPLGRFMRKHSIDELPQLINVLRGDMSIVGPRPPLPREVADYKPWQFRRLSVRPGLTCVWQVSGRNHIGFNQWMLLDMRYIDHWSLAHDAALMLKTVPVVLTGRGAS